MRLAVALLVLLTAPPARAHDAFGDLGPFYANLLHPLADPGQAVVLAGFAVLLARQPLATVRTGYALHALVAAVTVAALALLTLPQPPDVAIGALAIVLGAGVLLGPRLPAFAVPLLGVGAAILAGLAAERTDELRTMLLATLGAAGGLAAASLLLWSLFDLLRRRLGEIACAVAGSWIAAIGVMVAALPR